MFKADKPKKDCKKQKTFIDNCIDIFFLNAIELIERVFIIIYEEISRTKFKFNKYFLKSYTILTNI